MPVQYKLAGEIDLSTFAEPEQPKFQLAGEIDLKDFSLEEPNKEPTEQDWLNAGHRTVESTKRPTGPIEQSADEKFYGYSNTPEYQQIHKDERKGIYGNIPVVSAVAGFLSPDTALRGIGEGSRQVAAVGYRAGELAGFDTGADEFNRRNELISDAQDSSVGPRTGRAVASTVLQTLAPSKVGKAAAVLGKIPGLIGATAVPAYFGASEYNQALTQGADSEAKLSGSELQRYAISRGLNEAVVTQAFSAIPGIASSVPGLKKMLPMLSRAGGTEQMVGNILESKQGQGLLKELALSMPAELAEELTILAIGEHINQTYKIRPNETRDQYNQRMYGKDWLQGDLGEVGETVLQTVATVGALGSVQAVGSAIGEARSKAEREKLAAYVKKYGVDGVEQSVVDEFVANSSRGNLNTLRARAAEAAKARQEANAETADALEAANQQQPPGSQPPTESTPTPPVTPKPPDSTPPAAREPSEPVTVPTPEPIADEDNPNVQFDYSPNAEVVPGKRAVTTPVEGSVDKSKRQRYRHEYFDDVQPAQQTPGTSPVTSPVVQPERSSDPNVQEVQQEEGRTQGVLDPTPSTPTPVPGATQGQVGVEVDSLQEQANQLIAGGGSVGTLQAKLGIGFQRATKLFNNAKQPSQPILKGGNTVTVKGPLPKLTKGTSVEWDGGQGEVVSDDGGTLKVLVEDEKGRETKRIEVPRNKVSVRTAETMGLEKGDPVNVVGMEVGFTYVDTLPNGMINLKEDSVAGRPFTSSPYRVRPLPKAPKAEPAKATAKAKKSGKIPVAELTGEQVEKEQKKLEKKLTDGGDLTPDEDARLTAIYERNRQKSQQQQTPIKDRPAADLESRLEELKKNPTPEAGEVVEVRDIMAEQASRESQAATQASAESQAAAQAEPTAKPPEARPEPIGAKVAPQVEKQVEAVSEPPIAPQVAQPKPTQINKPVQATPNVAPPVPKPAASKQQFPPKQSWQEIVAGITETLLSDVEASTVPEDSYQELHREIVRRFAAVSKTPVVFVKGGARFGATTLFPHNGKGGFDKTVAFNSEYLEQGVIDDKIWEMIGDELSHDTQLDLTTLATPEEHEQWKQAYFAISHPNYQKHLLKFPSQLDREARAYRISQFFREEKFREALGYKEPLKFKQLVRAIWTWLFGNSKKLNAQRWAALSSEQKVVLTAIRQKMGGELPHIIGDKYFGKYTFQALLIDYNKAWIDLGNSEEEVRAKTRAMKTVWEGLAKMVGQNVEDFIAENIRGFDHATTGIAPEGSLFQPAFQGSGAKFPKHSLDYVLTGEGSMVKGYGHYFSQLREIAEHYREQAEWRNASKPSALETRNLKLKTIANSLHVSTDVAGILEDELDQFNNTITQSILDGKIYDVRAGVFYAKQSADRDINEVMDEIRKTGIFTDANGVEYGLREPTEEEVYKEAMSNLELAYNNWQWQAGVLKELEWLRSQNKDFVLHFKQQRPGAIYEVDLKPTDEELFLWDKSLSEQPKKVQDALIEINERYGLGLQKSDDELLFDVDGYIDFPRFKLAIAAAEKKIGDGAGDWYDMVGGQVNFTAFVRDILLAKRKGTSVSAYVQNLGVPSDMVHEFRSLITELESQQERIRGQVGQVKWSNMTGMDMYRLLANKLEVRPQLSEKAAKKLAEINRLNEDISQARKGVISYDGYVETKISDELKEWINNYYGNERVDKIDNPPGYSRVFISRGDFFNTLSGFEVELTVERRLLEPPRMTDRQSEKLASETLLHYGIRGNKHLTRASRNGRTEEDIYNYVIFSDDDVEIITTYLQNNGSNLGAVKIIRDGEKVQSMIYSFKGADIHTHLHEFAHIARQYLNPEQQAIANKYVLAETNEWTVAQEERFARGFERYMRDGAKGGKPELMAIFEQIAGWMRGLYQRLKGSPINIDVNQPIQRKVYASMIGSINPRVIKNGKSERGRDITYSDLRKATSGGFMDAIGMEMVQSFLKIAENDEAKGQNGGKKYGIEAMSTVLTNLSRVYESKTPEEQAEMLENPRGLINTSYNKMHETLRTRYDEAKKNAPEGGLYSADADNPVTGESYAAELVGKEEAPDAQLKAFEANESFEELLAKRADGTLTDFETVALNLKREGVSPSKATRRMIADRFDVALIDLDEMLEEQVKSAEIKLLNARHPVLLEGMKPNVMGSPSALFAAPNAPNTPPKPQPASVVKAMSAIREFIRTILELPIRVGSIKAKDPVTDTTMPSQYNRETHIVKMLKDKYGEAGALAQSIAFHLANTTAVMNHVSTEAEADLGIIIKEAHKVWKKAVLQGNDTDMSFYVNKLQLHGASPGVLKAVYEGRFMTAKVGLGTMFGPPTPEQIRSTDELKALDPLVRQHAPGATPIPASQGNVLEGFAEFVRMIASEEASIAAPNTYAQWLEWKKQDPEYASKVDEALKMLGNVMRATATEVMETTIDPTAESLDAINPSFLSVLRGVLSGVVNKVRKSMNKGLVYQELDELVGNKFIHGKADGPTINDRYKAKHGKGDLHGSNAWQDGVHYIHRTVRSLVSGKSFAKEYIAAGFTKATEREWVDYIFARFWMEIEDNTNYYRDLNKEDRYTLFGNFDTKKANDIISKVASDPDKKAKFDHMHDVYIHQYIDLALMHEAATGIPAPKRPYKMWVHVRRIFDNTESTGGDSGQFIKASSPFKGRSNKGADSAIANPIDELRADFDKIYSAALDYMVQDNIYRHFDVQRGGAGGAHISNVVERLDPKVMLTMESMEKVLPGIKNQLLAEGISQSTIDDLENNPGALGVMIKIFRKSADPNKTKQHVVHMETEEYNSDTKLFTKLPKPRLVVYKWDKDYYNSLSAVSDTYMTPLNNSYVNSWDTDVYSYKLNPIKGFVQLMKFTSGFWKDAATALSIRFQLRNPQHDVPTFMERSETARDLKEAAQLIAVASGKLSAYGTGHVWSKFTGMFGTPAAKPRSDMTTLYLENLGSFANQSGVRSRGVSGDLYHLRTMSSVKAGENKVAARLWDAIASTYHNAKVLGSLGEMVPRYAEYRGSLLMDGYGENAAGEIINLKTGNVEEIPPHIHDRAIRRAMDITIDFSQSTGLMQLFDAHAPLWAAAYTSFEQNWAKRIKAGKGAIATGVMKDLSVAAQRAIFMGVVSGFLYAAIKELDDEYVDEENIEEQKNTFQLGPLGWYRKPRGLRIFVNIGEAMWNGLRGRGGRAYAFISDKTHLPDNAYGPSRIPFLDEVPIPTQPFSKAAIEILINKDTLRDKPIDAMTTLLPKDRGDKASGLAQFLGQNAPFTTDKYGAHHGISPNAIDHMMNAITGGGWGTLTDIGDSTVSAVSSLAKGEAPDISEMKIPGYSDIFQRKAYNSSSSEIKDASESYDRQIKSHARVGDTNGKTQQWRDQNDALHEVKYRLDKANEIRGDLYGLWREAKGDKAKQDEIMGVITGVSRAGLGKKELGSYPNPFRYGVTFQDEKIQAVIDKQLASIADQASDNTSWESDKKEGKTDKFDDGILAARTFIMQNNWEPDYQRWLLETQKNMKFNTPYGQKRLDKIRRGYNNG